MWGSLQRGRSWLVCVCLGWLTVAFPASANVILGEHDWDLPAGGALGWYSDTGNSTIERLNSGGHPDGWLRIGFPANPDPGEYVELARLTQATDLFAGNWQPNMWVQFDFWAESLNAEAVEVRWEADPGVTGGSGGYTWRYTLGAANAGWNTFSASFANHESWRDAFGPSASAFLADLSAIDWIGVYIQRGAGADEALYGLDNFRLMVPEPAEIVLLAAAALGFVLLRRRAVTPAAGPVGA